MEEPFILLGLAATCLLIAFWLIVACFRWYEIAVFLVALSPLKSAIFVTLQSVEQETTIGSYIRVSLLTLMRLVGMIKFVLWRISNHQKLPLQFKLLMFFFLIAFISIAYSLNPTQTLIRVSSFFALFGFLLGLYAWLIKIDRIDKALNSLFYMIILVVIANLISLLFLADRVWWREEARFCGLWGHPNMMGLFAMVSYPVLLWKYSQIKISKKWTILIIIGLLFILHLLTGSRASSVASLFGFSVWFIIMKQKVKLMIIIFVGSLLGMLVLSITTPPESFLRETESGASITTLTGRTEFWYSSLILISERPIYGYGFGVGGEIWNDARFYNPDYALWSGTARSSLHNGYLSIAIGVGIVGTIVWVILLLIPYLRCRKLRLLKYKAFLLSILAMCLLLNFVEDVIGGGNTPGSIILWISWVIGGRMAQMDIFTY